MKYKWMFCEKRHPRISFLLHMHLRFLVYPHPHEHPIMWAPTHRCTQEQVWRCLCCLQRDAEDHQPGCEVAGPAPAVVIPGPSHPPSVHTFGLFKERSGRALLGLLFIALCCQDFCLELLGKPGMEGKEILRGLWAFVSKQKAVTRHTKTSYSADATKC